MRDKDSVICDLAEYYHILDYEGLPVEKLAALVSGLPDQSRTKARITGNRRFSQEDLLLALIADSLQTLVWMQSEDGRTGRNRPRSIVALLTGIEQKDKANVFEGPEAFMEARAKILSGEGGAE